MTTFHVHHNEGQHRFETGQSPHLAILTYVPEGERVIFDHTFVPTELRGKGIGAILARAGLEEARRRGWQVVPQCWFIAEYIERNPEFRPLVEGNQP